MIAFPGRVGMEIDGDWWKWWDEMHSHSAFHWCHNHQLFIINLTLSIPNFHSQASLSLSILNLIVTLIVPTVACHWFFSETFSHSLSESQSLTETQTFTFTLSFTLFLFLAFSFTFTHILTFTVTPRMVIYPTDHQPQQQIHNLSSLSLATSATNTSKWSVSCIFPLIGLYGQTMPACTQV